MLIISLFIISIMFGLCAWLLFGCFDFTIFLLKILVAGSFLSIIFFATVNIFFNLWSL